MKRNQTVMMFVSVAFIIASCQKAPAVPAQNQQDAALQQNVATAARCANADSYSKEITNPYLPFDPGTTKWYINITIENGIETVTKTKLDVTNDTKLILGVKCTVVHVQTTEGGTLV